MYVLDGASKFHLAPAFIQILDDLFINHLNVGFFFKMKFVYWGGWGFLIEPAWRAADECEEDNDAPAGLNEEKACVNCDLDMDGGVGKIWVAYWMPCPGTNG